MGADSNHPEEVSAELFDFLNLYARDRESGQRRDVSEYLARFPICREAILHEVAAAETGGLESTQDEPRCIGPYRVLEEIGRGGQGVVYLAEDDRIARRVALKVLPASSLLFFEAKRGRLRREAELVSRLDHPGICGIYDAEISGDHAYIAMPVIPGITLGAAIHLVREGVAATQPLPLAPTTRAELHELLEFFEGCALALHAAHEAGVVHRDIKPGNLMVTPEGRGVWLDFGQALDSESASRALTVSGEVFGTPAYMSPEQIAGDIHRVDARTDVWALGVSLFEALTLERPFRGTSTHALLTAVQEAPPISACALRPSLPRDVDVVIETALEKDLSRRYSSALEFAKELGRIRRSVPIHARPAGPALRLRRWARRSPILFTTISGSLLALTLALLWTLYLLSREERALDFALGRHLGERAVALLDEDPAVSLALAIEAVERAPSYLTRSALFASLDRCYLARELDSFGARRFRDLVMVGDGQQVAAALADGSVKLYDIASGDMKRSWDLHDEDALLLAHRDGRIASVGLDGDLVLVDSDSDETPVRVDLGEFEPTRLDLVAATGESPMLVVVGAQDGSIRAFEASSGGAPELSRTRLEHLAVQLSAEVESTPPDFLEPEVRRRTVLAVPSPHGTHWATVLDDGAIHLWDAESGRRTRHWMNNIYAPVKLLWSLDGEYLVGLCKGRNLRVWYGTNRPDLYDLEVGDSPVIRCGFSRDGETALTISEDRWAHVWSTPSTPSAGREIGALIAKVKIDGGEAWAALRMDFEHVVDPVVRLPLQNLTQGVTKVKIRRAPDGQGAASLHSDGFVRFWDLEQSRLVWESELEVEGHRLEGVDIAFHPDGSELVVACVTGRLLLFETKSGTSTRAPLRCLEPRSVEWSADGEHLLILGHEGRSAFNVRHIETGALARTEVNHYGDITSGCFSPDGKMVLTTSMDGAIFIRDVSDGSPIVHLQGSGAAVTDAAFSTGAGPLRVIGSFADGSARVWPVDPLPCARARQPRELSGWEVAREERLALPLKYR